MIDAIFNKISEIYYHIYYFAFGIPMNLLIFYLILKKTAKVFESMKYFLIPASFSTLILSSLTFFLQVRTVNNTKSLAILGQGYCKMFGAEICFQAYIWLLSLSAAVAVLNSHIIFYRMIFMKFQERKTALKYVYLYCINYLIPLITVIFCNIPEKNMDAVYNETITQHPDYSFEPFGKFGGFVNTYNVFTSANTIILALGTVYFSIIGFYCRWSSLKILDLSKTSLSQKNVDLFKSLIHGFTVQTILPLTCYIPVAISFLYNKYNENDQLIFSQYLVGTLLTLPAVMNPMLNIYFIVPYRVALRRMILLNRSEIESEPRVRFRNNSINPSLHHHECLATVAN